MTLESETENITAEACMAAAAARLDGYLRHEGLAIWPPSC